MVDSYFSGLQAQNEISFKSTIHSLHLAGVRLSSPELITDLLTLHHDTGLLRAGRLIAIMDTPTETRQDIFEDTVSHLVAAIHDPNYRPDEKVAYVSLPGAQDHFIEDTFGLHFGKHIQNLIAQNYRVYVFEVHSDIQMLRGGKRVKEWANVDHVDVDLLVGHGAEDAETNVTGSGLNLGQHLHQSVYDYQRAHGKSFFGSKDRAAVDISDGAIFTAMKDYISAEHTTRIIFSCGAGAVTPENSAEENSSSSLAKESAAATGAKTFASSEAIVDMKVQYDAEGNIVDVGFLKDMDNNGQPEPATTIRFEKVSAAQHK